MKMMDFIDSYGVVGLAQILPHGQALNSNANVFFVENSSGADSAGYGNSWEAPFATLDYAIGQCSGTSADVILIAPGHTENVSAAGGITCDRANVTIIGLGRGSAKPTFTFTATAATIVVSAANVTIQNITVLPGIDEVVTMFYVTGAFCTLDGIDHPNTNVGSSQTIQFLLTTNAADYLVVKNCRHYQSTAAAANSKWIQLVGPEGVVIRDNVFFVTTTNNANSVIISGSTAVVHALIKDNVIYQGGGTTVVSNILLVDSSTGAIVTGNHCAGPSAAAAKQVDVGNAGYGFENYVCILPDLSGVIGPATS